MDVRMGISKPGKCSYCDQPLQDGEYMTHCSVCGSVHHEQCWIENGRCTTFGCVGRPAKVIRVRLPDEPVLAAEQTVGSVGKTCPYCQVPIKLGAPTKICPACQIPHHEECWLENGGCTTFGCAGTPGPAWFHDHAAVPTHRPTPALNCADLTSAVCPYCGGDVAPNGSDGSCRCRSCGMELELDSVGQVETHVVCAGCGRRLPSGMVWCPVCNQSSDQVTEWLSP